MSFHINDPSLKQKRQRLRRDQTDAERRLWYYLRNKRLNGFKFFRQYSVGAYILDFYCPKCRLAIEVDGGQHMDNAAQDAQRTHFLNEQNIRVVRFWNNDVLGNTDTVLEEILKHLS